MQETMWRVGEDDLRAWLDGLLADGRSVVAPVEQRGLRLFRPVASASEVSLAPGKTRWSPKEFLFPRSETLYGYTLRASAPRLEDPPLPEREQVLFGVRACDAAGLLRLDRVFCEGRVEDPFYARRRELTLVVALACTRADPECFCTAVGGSPGGTAGVDLQLAPFGADWIARALTPAGRALVRQSWRTAAPRDWALAEDQLRATADKMSRSGLSPEVAATLERRFDGSEWNELGELCLSCRICTYVCPSCSCFDVHHEANAWGGRELRCWDACTHPLFTRHASGHNPRQEPGARCRQRVLHKFAYRSPQHADSFRCVGCGRCIALCPAGIDIHGVVKRVVARAAEGDRV